MLSRYTNLCAFAGAVLCAGVAAAQDTTRLRQIPVSVDRIQQSHATSLGRVGDEPFDGGGFEPRGGECQVVSGLASQEFDQGEYFVQAGFVEREIAAVSYTLDPSVFPIRIDLIEALIGHAGTSVATTTEYSILVWEGTPATGSLVGVFSSDGVVIPHVELPPSPTPAAQSINFLIDPADPEQIFINNAGGSNTFSVGIRIDRHNAQTGSGCFPPPPETQNAFPMTDTDGANQTQNWINAIDCGPLGCTPGWSSFQQFPSFCTPSGDWMIRATWTSFDCSQLPGACCDGEGGCTELSQPACDASGGVFQGTGTTCAETSCPIPEGACCLSNNNCLQLTESDCGLLGGDWQGGNTACDGAICPIGAACLPDGSCIDGITQLDADMLGAVFQGVGTECDGLECPAPVGACCVTTSLTCIELEEDQCMLVPNAIWQGPGSLCDGDGDGVPDGMCDPAADCLPDVNDDGTLDGSDFFAWVNAFSTGGPGCDQNGDGECGSPDFFAWVAGFGQGC